MTTATVTPETSIRLLGLPQRICTRLNRNDIHTVADLQRLSARSLPTWLGRSAKKSIAAVLAACEQHGITLATDEAYESWREQERARAVREADERHRLRIRVRQFLDRIEPDPAAPNRARYAQVAAVALSDWLEQHVGIEVVHLAANVLPYRMGGMTYDREHLILLYRDPR